MKRSFARLALHAVWMLPLVGAIGLGAAVLVYALNSQTPLDGTFTAPGLRQPVSVTRNASDVTTIQAQSATDAWYTMGWVHASERAWQLEFNRRVVRGTLSEVLGEATLDTDKLLRTLGIYKVAQQQLAALPAKAQQALQAYSNGINDSLAGQTQWLTPEFTLLGVNAKARAQKGQFWTPADSVGWSLMMALDLGGNWSHEFARFSLLQTLDTQALWQIMPPYARQQIPEAPATSLDLGQLYQSLGAYSTDGVAPSRARADVNGLREQVGAAANAWVAQLGSLDGKGSNNWVVAGQNTRSGQPMLANDPHLGLSAPALWYVAHLKAPASDEWPAMDVRGATLPGLPVVVLGHTAGVAWGFTNVGPDVQDLYLEQLKPDAPDLYRVPSPAGAGEFQTFATRAETIKIKGDDDYTFTVRSSRHGPVVSDVQPAYDSVLDKTRYAIALRWSALEPNNKTVLAGLNANFATDVASLEQAYADHHSPMQNVVMADTNGRIRYKAIGTTPVRNRANDIMGVAPNPGWDAKYDWAGWLPYADTPEDDGAAGWIATANQRIHDTKYPHFITSDWATSHRMRRISKLMAQSPLHDAQSFATMQMDQVSLSALSLLPYLQRSTSDHVLAPAAAKALAGFDGDMRVNSPAALMVSVWAHELTQLVIRPRLGQDKFDKLYGKRQFREGLLGILASDNTDWCGQAGCKPLMNQALTLTLNQLSADMGPDLSKWQWGNAHTAISSHKPFGNVGVLAKLFNVQVPVGGDGYTVNVGRYHASGERPFAVVHAASLRAIYDLSDLSKSQFMYQTGQSGNVLSNRYGDMSAEWANGRYRLLGVQGEVPQHTMQLLPTVR
ncbi:penicillin acylase family protein [Comamonadaceae bacterium M7527]|nr:penicillin acylase family protein [Comamonadaceae bacterium M7527]